MAKFKVGDKVVGNAKANKYNITREGFVGTVTRVGRTIIDLDIFKGLDADCFDLYNDAHQNKIVITTDGKTTTARLYDGKAVIKSAEAKCAPSDIYDFTKGARLAYNRLMYGTDYHPAEVALKPKTTGCCPTTTEDKPKYKVGDKVRCVGTSKLFNNAFIKDEYIGEVFEIQSINPNKGFGLDVEHYGIGKAIVFFVDELEPYTEPTKEPIKLYCVKVIRKEGETCLTKHGK